MTALAEALLAAQRQALAELEKAYIAGRLEDDAMLEHLDSIGVTDSVDRFHWLEAVNTLKALGVQANGAALSRPAALDEPATKAQLDFIAKLSDDKGRVVNVDGMTKAQASAVIEALKRDEEVPF